jgi:Sap, sulfolipid-1-addressing protein
MSSAVLVLALIAAMDPVRIGIVALLISRPRPMLNLLAFWLGGMAAGIVAALVVLFILRDLMLSVMRVVVSAFSSPIIAHIQVAIGVLAVVIAALITARFWARQRAPVPVTGGESSVLVLERNTPTGSSRLSIRDQLEGGSLVMPLVAGVALATPPVEYLTAIIAILASRAAATAQVSAALMFTLVAFTIVEIPLISYLATPAKTLAVVLRLHDWISARRQAILAVVVGAVGFLLAVTGMGKA